MNNRLYRGDCKTIADELIKQNVKVDLIYLDPPFNSNRTYSMLFNHRGIAAQQKAYHDMWDFTDSTRQLVLDFKDELEKWELPDSFKDFMKAWLGILEQGTSDDRKLLNYLMYMTQRLIRLKKLLTPTGSIYFHCDPTASHYIKVMMDGVFGNKNFRNEITWKRFNFHADARRYGAITDRILFYSKGDAYTFNRVKVDYSKGYIDSKFTHKNKDGRRYRLENLNPPGGRGPVYDFNGVTRAWRTTEDKMKKMDAEGLIYKDSKVAQLKRYLDEMPGQAVADLWVDIPAINSQAKERLGYPTQKPVALLKRIIEASSNPGDVVFDPFCGCGTTIEAAHRLKRAWIGVDISGSAVDEIKDRMAEQGVYNGEEDNYDLIESSPDTMDEYKRLNPYEKQDWLIRKLGGLPNPKKSGDFGVDGDMTFHLGMDKAGNDQWGRLIFSVKTGKQKNPAHVRELKGTMKGENAQIGVLILDIDPTQGMEDVAQNAGQFEYQLEKTMPPKYYDKIQIITAYEIIEGGQVDCPPTMHEIKNYRKVQKELRV